MSETLDVERKIEEFLGDPRCSKREGDAMEIAALELLQYVETIPGQWHPEDWAQVRLALEQQPEGAWYRGHLVAWVSASRPGEWLHEVDEDADHRFESLVQALLFIDVLER